MRKDYRLLLNIFLKVHRPTIISYCESEKTLVFRGIKKMLEFFFVKIPQLSKGHVEQNEMV